MRRRALARALPVALLVPAGVPSAVAQEALVLSTGASRGFVHAGAVLGLDSLGYDPDLVIGTSMGAVIGALYAAGYEPREIWDLLLATDWGDLFRPVPLVVGPEREVRFPMVSLGVSFADGEVTRGFVAAWRVNRLLTHLLLPAAAASRGDFDRLPRRYRAVAADLSTGREVVLGRGDLARSVRMSMGTPGFFAPVEQDGHLLTDGGIANYLPISVARGLGAVHVVAVDASRPDPEIHRRDPAAVGSRAIALLMRNAVEDTVADVLVRPDIDPDFPGAVFPADPTELMRLGLEAALRAPPREGGPRPTRRSSRSPERFSALRIESSDSGLARMTRRLFSDVAPGPWDPALVLARMDRLYATGLVSGVWPRVEAEGGVRADGSGPPTGLPAGGRSGGDVLVVRVDALPRTSLGAAAAYDNDRGGKVWADLQQRLALGVPVELTLAGSLDDLERWGEASVRIHSTGWPHSWTSGGYYLERDTRVFEADSLREREVRRAGGWLAAEVRHIYPDWIGALALHGQWIDVQDGPEGLAVGPTVRVSTAPPPNLVVGSSARLEAELRFGDLSYRAASLRVSRGVPFPAFPAAVVLGAAITGGDPPPDVLPALGDHHAVPGLRWGEERGRGRLFGGLDVAFPILTGAMLRARLRAGAAPDELEGLGEGDAWVGGAALEGVWTPPFGPVSVGVAASTRGTWRLDLNLGRIF